MIIYEKEERPFVETPDPRLGVVLDRLNKLSLEVEISISKKDTEVASAIGEINKLLGEFSSTLRAITTKHTNLRGAVHGETKDTIGLGKVDNYRKASTAEVNNGSNVNAWVTVGDAKKKVEEAIRGVDDTNLQKNLFINFSSYFLTDKYPRRAFTPAGSNSFFSGANNVINPKELDLLLNDDDIFYVVPTTKSLTPTSSNTSTAFLTSPLVGNNFHPRELMDLDIKELRTYGLNVGIAKGIKHDNKVVNLLFRKVGETFEARELNSLSTNLNNSINFAEITSTGFGEVSGIYTEVELPTNNTSFSVRHVLVDVDGVENIQLKPRAGSTFSRVDIAGTTTGATTDYRVRNLSTYLNLQTGQVAKVNPTLFSPKINYYWSVKGKTLVANILIPVTITGNGITKDFKLSISEEVVIPVKKTGTVIRVKELGTLAKSNVSAKLETPVNSSLSLRDPSNALDLSYGSSVLTKEGVLIKGVYLPQGVYLKHFKLGQDFTARELINAQTNGELFSSNNGKLMSHVSARQDAIPPLTTDIIHFDKGVQLVEGLDKHSGTIRWMIKYPSGALSPIGNASVPNETISYEYKDQATGLRGRKVSGMVFRERNNFTGYKDISLIDDKIVKTGKVSLSVRFKSMLNLEKSKFLNRAKLAMPNVLDSNRKADPVVIEKVFTGTGLNTITKRLFVYISDGCGYLEEFNTDKYSVVGDQLDIRGSLTFKRFTPSIKGENTNYLNNDKYSTNSATGDSLFNDSVRVITHELSGGNNKTQFIGLAGKGSLLTRLTNNNFISTEQELLQPILYFKDTHVSVSELPRSTWGLIPNYYYFPLATPDNNKFYLPEGERFVFAGETVRSKVTLSTTIPATGKGYLYIVKEGEVLSLMTSTLQREPNRYELAIATYDTGKVTFNKDYILMDDKLVSIHRKGSAIPAFAQDNINRFFKIADIIDFEG